MHYRRTLSAYIFATKACIDNRKKLVKQQYLFHKYNELPGALDPDVILPAAKFILRPCLASGRQPNFVAWYNKEWN